MTQLASHCHHYTAARTAALISMLVVMSAPVLADEYAVTRYSSVRVEATTAQRDLLAGAKAQRSSADDKQASHPRNVTVPDMNPLTPAAAPPKACNE
jgi:hypothetical protein